MRTHTSTMKATSQSGGVGGNWRFCACVKFPDSRAQLAEDMQARPGRNGIRGTHLLVEMERIEPTARGIVTPAPKTIVGDSELAKRKDDEMGNALSLTVIVVDK